MNADQQKKIDGFAETATQSTHSAYVDLVAGKFDDWDKAGSHLNALVGLQDDWKKVAKDKGLFYDLQKVRAVQANKQFEKNEYNKQITQDLTKAGWPDEFDEDAYLELRKAAHKDATLRAYAEDRAVKMLHAKAGYLIEERTYQKLPKKDEVAWTEQDTGILGGGTRPDITLPVEGRPGKVALLDITASNSQGHIFDKTPKWTESNKVVDSVEILYPSLDQPTLIATLLDKQSFTPEEAQSCREAYEAKVADQAAQEKRGWTPSAARSTITASPSSRTGSAGATPANHLVRYFLGSAKGYSPPRPPRPTSPRRPMRSWWRR